MTEMIMMMKFEMKKNHNENDYHFPVFFLSSSSSLSLLSSVLLFMYLYLSLEIDKIGDHGLIRYDVLAAVLTEVNSLLTIRFDSFIAEIVYTVKNKVARLKNDNSGEYEEIEEEDVVTESHELLEHASLGELLSLIDWISRYYHNLREIICPVATAAATTAGSTASITTSYSKLSGKYLTPKQCGIFRFTTKLCKLYAHGGSIGAKGMWVIRFDLSMCLSYSLTHSLSLSPSLTYDFLYSSLIHSLTSDALTHLLPHFFTLICCSSLLSRRSLTSYL
jgi:hypothetical protein